VVEKAGLVLDALGQWRRGKVTYIGNDGFVAVTVYQKGTLGIGVGFSVEQIPHVLKLVEK
jgi:hypothetical protein